MLEDFLRKTPNYKEITDKWSTDVYATSFPRSVCPRRISIKFAIRVWLI